MDLPSATSSRAVDLSLNLPDRLLQFGATGALLGGMAASIEMPPGWDGLVRAVAAWFVAVVLIGSVRDRALRARRKAAHRRPGSGSLTVVARAKVQLERLLAMIRSEGELPLFFESALALLVAGLISAAVLVVVVVALGALWHIAHSGEARGRRSGAVNSAMEILIPGIVGWLALGGATAVPASVAPALGLLAEVRVWIDLNWLLPGLMVGFTLVHHGATAVRRRDELVPSRWQMVLGYLLAVSLLVLAELPFHAYLLALAFVVQWPFQSAFQAGYVRWHWKSVEMIALTSMLVAAFGVRGWP